MIAPFAVKPSSNPARLVGSGSLAGLAPSPATAAPAAGTYWGCAPAVTHWYAGVSITSRMPYRRVHHLPEHGRGTLHDPAMARQPPA